MSEIQLEYAGYTGSAEVSLEDGCLHGKILDIHDLVTYEADTVAGLRDAFVASVQHYLEKCEQYGLTPDHPAPSPALEAPPCI